MYLFNPMMKVSEENAKQINDADLVRNNAGKRYAVNDTLTMITKLDVQKFPESVVILTDNGTGSSSEFFLIYAKQSSKVKVMGQKTHGATDIGIGALESPDKQFLLMYGIFIMAGVKDTQYLDYGIQPDIFLPKNLDWIEEAKKYLEY